MTYPRPHGTTANPEWQYAERPTDLIPSTDDPHGDGAEMVHYCGDFLLTQGDVAGRRLGECYMPWQRDLIRYVFGEMNRAGRRAVKKVFLKIGKGSSKSVLCSAIALAWTMRSAERRENTRSLVAIIAASVGSADIVFRYVLEGVLNDEHLKGQFVSNTQRRSITHVESGIEIMVLPPRRDAVVGKRPSLVIVDELHEAAMDPQFSAVLDQLVRGGANWPDFLQIAISTAPMLEARGAYATTLQDARRVRDGEVDNPTFLPVLFEWPSEREDLDVEDAREWWRGLPSLDVALPIEAITHEYQEAKVAASGEPMQLFLSQRLGIEPEARNAVDGLILQDRWADLPKAPILDIDREAERQHQLFVAFDPFSGADDPFAMVVGWEHDGVIYLRSQQYLAQEGYDRAPVGLRDLYDLAIKQRELQVLPTAGQMVKRVLDDLASFHDKMGSFPILGGDVYGSAGFAGRVRDRFACDYIKIPQGWQLKAALTDLEAAAMDGMLAHPHTALLDFNIKNLVVEDTASGRRFSKRGAGASGQGTQKIDGAMAALSCVYMMASHAPEVADLGGMIEGANDFAPGVRQPAGWGGGNFELPASY